MKNKKAVFKSVDEWKSALMNLPDNNFFELLRTVFGSIKTPFNKQRLLDDLFSYLSRNDTKKIISSYIDETDHKIIAAITILENPAQNALNAFFEGEFNKAQVQSLLVNLEERLLVYRYSHEGVQFLSLNPVLESILIPFMEDTSVLFPCNNSNEKKNFISDGDSSLIISGAREMAALFSFLASEEELFREKNYLSGIRKKVIDDAKKIFPHIDLELAAGTFIRLGLFREEGGKILVNREKFSSFKKLSPMEIASYLAAGVYLSLEKRTENQERFDSFAFFPSRNRIRILADFFHRFRNYLDNGHDFPETTLRRFFELLERENRPVWGAQLFNEKSPVQFEIFHEAVIKTGFLWNQFYFRNTESKITPDEDHADIVMDTAFSFLLYPEISLNDSITLSEFCNIGSNIVFNKPLYGDKETELPVVTFMINRDSVIRAFDLGINSESIIELLNKLSNNRLDPVLGWTIKEWESRYSEISLSRGVILILSEERRYLADVEPVSVLIKKCIAPGVYLLSADECSEAVSALKKTGVDIIAQPSVSGDEKSYTDRRSSNSFSSLGLIEYRTAFPNEKNNSGGKHITVKDTVSEADSIKENFRLTLDKMNLTKQERDELTARIDRRLVLSESQLEKSTVRYEKLEARGLDFAGKNSIAKSAVDNASLVEVFWPGSGGVNNTCIGLAQALEKKGSESILVINDAGSLMSVPLSKISFLRRIKQSIFGE